jgi:hypothetical protein
VTGVVVQSIYHVPDRPYGLDAQLAAIISDNLSTSPMAVENVTTTTLISRFA